jgi:hypothetical protein
MVAVLQPPAAEEETERRSKGEQVARQTICLEIFIRSAGFRCSASASEMIATDTDTTLFRVSKDLIDPKELKPIRRADANLKAWLAGRAVPSSIIRGGMYLIPLAMLEEVDREITGFKAKREELVREFVDRYEELKAEARERLKGCYNECEYPPAGEVFDAFGVEARWLTFDVPAALKSLNRSVYEREKKKAELQWSYAADEIRDALRASYAELVTAMTEKLGEDPETGKPRVFRDSYADKLKEFLATFEARNLTNDEELSRLTLQAKELLRGVNPKDLREQKDFRAKVAEGFEQIKRQMSGMVTTKARKFSLNEDV